MPPTVPGERDSEDACESLLSEFAPGVSPEVRAALRAALQAASADGVSVELDPALQGEIELDPALSGVIETDPSLDPDIALDPELGEAEAPDRKLTSAAPDRTAPARSAPAEAAPDTRAATVESTAAIDDPPAADTENGAAPTDRPDPISKKSTAGPTLRPPHALVVPRTDAGKPSNRPSEDVRAVSEAVESAEASPPIDEPMAEEPMFENRERHDGAESSAEEASMAETTTQAQPEDRAEPVADAEPVAEPKPEVDAMPTAAAAVEADPAPAELTEEATGDVGPRSAADDLFEAVPRAARHFMALLAREGTLLMPQVMAHLGLVRPKGVGGAVEPIQRVARLIGAEMPFEADFAPSGYKRWTWRAEPLSDVPEEVLAPIPAPPPQKKKRKPKPKADRSRYVKAWKRSLEAKKRKGRGRRTGKRRNEKPAAAKAAQPPASDATSSPRPTPAPRVPAAHRDESGNADRPGRRGAPTSDTRRRRQDRPMPEVFHRANRPASRPPPTRRDEVRSRPSEAAPRPAAARPAAARPAVPRLDRPASDASTTSPPIRRGVTTPEERLPLPRSGAFRRRTVGDSDVPVVVIRRRKR